jgi:hypothetical protein
MSTPRTTSERSATLSSLRLGLAGLVGAFALLPVPCLAPRYPGPASCQGIALARSAGAAAPEPTGIAGPDDGSRRRAELLDQLGVRAWHAAGCQGQGIKVAVLDSGFHGYRAHLDKALPEHVTVKSFRGDGDLEARDSQHGILCGEVIHTLAPEAELLFATWEPEQPAQFLDAVRWAREQGARVLSCSVIMPSWSDGEGHGPAHETLARLLGAGKGGSDALCFASAGNTAERHWGGPFHDAGDGRHEWARGVTENVVTPWGIERVSVELCCPPEASYELALEDAPAGRPRRARTVHGCAVIGFAPERGHTYRVGVRRAGGAPGAFHLVVLGGGLEYATRGGSIPFPGDGPEVVAVGAVDRAGRRWAYSSCGPNASGPKPDFVATVPFPSAWREQPFTGTSAAAPQAAALSALVWSCHPDWTAARVRDVLRSAARRLGSSEHDDETGFGLLHLPGTFEQPLSSQERF